MLEGGREGGEICSHPNCALWHSLLEISTLICLVSLAWMEEGERQAAEAQHVCLTAEGTGRGGGEH